MVIARILDPKEVEEEIRKLPGEFRLARVKQIFADIPDNNARSAAERWFLLGVELSPEQATPNIVLLVHGIRTRAEWQERLRDELAAYPGIRVIPIGFDYVDAVRFWLPAFFGLRKGPKTKVLNELRNIRADFPTADISVIAHSFGTYLVTEILRKVPDVRLRRLLLCGSIVRPNFPWATVPNRPKETPLNDAGTGDIWPVMARVLSWGYGNSGTFGFKTQYVYDRFHNLTHSQFFTASHYGKYWIPFLIDGTIRQSEWDTVRPARAWLWSAVCFAPVRWLVKTFVIVASMFAIGGIFVYLILPFGRLIWRALS